MKVENDVVTGKDRRVKFSGDPRWWTVKALSPDERFVVLTRKAAFGRGVYYTIVDNADAVRGPCNLIGQSWDEQMKTEACEALIVALTSSEVEISHRNRVDVDVTARSGFDSEATWLKGQGK